MKDKVLEQLIRNIVYERIENDVIQGNDKKFHPDFYVGLGEGIKLGMELIQASMSIIKQIESN